MWSCMVSRDINISPRAIPCLQFNIIDLHEKENISLFLSYLALGLFKVLHKLHRNVYECFSFRLSVMPVSLTQLKYRLFPALILAVHVFRAMCQCKLFMHFPPHG